MANHGLDLAGVVIGSWPAEPDLAERCNVADLEMLAARPLAGAVPENCSGLSRGGVHQGRAGISRGPFGRRVRPVGLSIGP